MNHKMIRYIIGLIVKLEGLLMLVPGFVSLFYRERVGYVLFGVAVALILTGFLLSYKRPEDASFYAKEGMVIVSMAWIVLSLFGALPFYISGEIPSYVDAFFETVSGFTTTGSTILTDIEVMSNGLLFWRSFTHWIGGMGVLVFAFAVLPQNHNNNMYLMKAEVPGHKVGKLVSKMSSTARILYGIYITLTIIEVILLKAGGMSFFDSWIHAFSTAGTGGFSSRNASIAYYNSAYIEGVITVFMILFGVNFQLYYFILIGNVKEFFSSEELRTYLLVIGAAIAVITFNIIDVVGGVWPAFRASAFQVASIITTTGFVTENYEQWPYLSQGILLLLMFIGAMAGSTGGGMKVSRIILLVKNAYGGMRKMLSPNRVISMRFEEGVVRKKVIEEVHVYMNIYALVFAASTLILLSQDLDLITSFASVSCCLNNVGPGLGVTNPVSNFSSLTAITKIVLSFNMLAGRLELFPVAVIFLPSTWFQN